MTWLRVPTTLPDHAQTLAVAGALGVDRVVIAGHLVVLWLWALDHVGADGVLAAALVAPAARWPGDGAAFTAALATHGFLDATADPATVALHNWARYTGALYAQRAQRASPEQQTARRVRGNAALAAAIRARDGDACAFCGRTVNWRDHRSLARGTYARRDPGQPCRAANVVVACGGCAAQPPARRGQPAAHLPAPAPLAAPAALAATVHQILARTPGWGQAVPSDERWLAPLLADFTAQHPTLDPVLEAEQFAASHDGGEIRSHRALVSRWYARAADLGQTPPAAPTGGGGAPAVSRRHTPPKTPAAQWRPRVEVADA